ncbi:MAG: hypothetical protein P8N40_04585, partial [Gammaproteobacteria bacterium]|nr:hypothetical protein [Gammaproteobacteria bacterium]
MLTKQKLIFLLSIITFSTVTMSVQAQSGDIPRAADGKPDFSGIWQAIGSSHYNIEPHSADFGPMFQLGA